MKWDEKNKERLRDVLKSKIGEIIALTPGAANLNVTISQNPNMKMVELMVLLKPFHKARDKRIEQFFAEFDIECDSLMRERENCIVLDTALIQMPLWDKLSAAPLLKGPQISIPEDVAEKFLVLGVP